MNHKPVVDEILEPVKILQPSCSCGWEGIPVTKRNDLTYKDEVLFGNYSSATAQLRLHIRSLLDSRDLRNFA